VISSLVDFADLDVVAGELICLKFAGEGCNVVVNYNSSAGRAEGVAKKVEQDYGMKAFAVQGVGQGKENLQLHHFHFRHMQL